MMMVMTLVMMMMMVLMMLMVMTMTISQMELWRRGGRFDFRQKVRAPDAAEARGSVERHLHCRDRDHEEEEEQDNDDEEEDNNDDDEEDNNDDLSRLHLFSRGLQAGLVQCQ